MSFRWQTDDDSDEPLASRQAQTPGRRRHRRRLMLLALLALVSAGVFFAWRNVRQRAAATEARIKQDVLSLHNLAQNAISGGDDEIYLSLLPPQFPGWAETQQRLLEEELLFTGAARLYNFVPLPDTAGEPQVEVDPSLSHATVSTQHSFAFTSTAPLGESVSLRQIHTYSLGATGWQIAPPPPDFWSPEIIVPGSPITLHYPQRDETVALQLLSELERRLPQMCALPGLTCPPDLQLTVRLVPDPASLAESAEPEAFLQSDSWRQSGQIDLPAPSLIGQPLDEVGEALVVRAYAARTLAPLISDFAGYNCCARGLFARAIVERQLVHLQLHTWPLTPDHYETLMAQGLTLGDALVLQARDVSFTESDSWLQMLSLIEFLEESLPTGDLLSHMETSLDYWLLNAEEPGDFVVGWTEAVYARSRSAQRAAELDPLPQGVLQLTCFGSGAVAVQHYDLQGAGWQHGITYNTSDGWQIESVFPLPADYGEILKVTQHGPEGNRLARYLWAHSGGSSTLFGTVPSEDGPSLFAPYDGLSPQWRSTLLSPQYPALRKSVEQEWWQIELPDCSSGECQDQTWKARPRWSPDGTQLLLEAQPQGKQLAEEDLVLLHAGHRGQNAVEVGNGYAPVWLDATHYAFLRALEDSSNEVLTIASLEDGSFQQPITGVDLVALLGDELDNVSSLRLEQLQRHPTNPHLLLLRAWRRPPLRDGSVDNAYLLALKLSSDFSAVGEVTLLHRAGRSLEFLPSPTGRWLAVYDYAQWLLIDLENGERHTLASPGIPAWSPDGNWLAQSSDYHIMLHAPGLEYSRPIVHQLGDCPFSSLQWQSR